MATPTLDGTGLTCRGEQRIDAAGTGRERFGAGCLQRIDSSTRDLSGGNTNPGVPQSGGAGTAMDSLGMDGLGTARAVISGEHLLGVHRWQHQLACSGAARQGKAGQGKGCYQRSGRSMSVHFGGNTIAARFGRASSAELCQAPAGRATARAANAADWSFTE